MRKPRNIPSSALVFPTGTIMLIPCRYKGGQHEFEAKVVSVKQQKGAWIHTAKFCLARPGGGPELIQLNGYAVRRCVERLDRQATVSAASKLPYSTTVI